MFENGFLAFGKKGRKRKDEDTLTSDTVSDQAADSAASTNMALLGNNSAYSLDQTLMAQSQAHGTLFANMVSEQQRQVTMGQASAIKITADIFGISPEELMASHNHED